MTDTLAPFVLAPDHGGPASRWKDSERVDALMTRWSGLLLTTCRRPDYDKGLVKPRAVIEAWLDPKTTRAAQTRGPGR